MDRFDSYPILDPGQYRNPRGFAHRDWNIAPGYPVGQEPMPRQRPSPQVPLTPGTSMAKAAVPFTYTDANIPAMQNRPANVGPDIERQMFANYFSKRGGV